MIYTYENISKNTHIHCDVCVIGSGAGGAVVAKELQAVGLKVVLLEEGSHVPLDALPLADTARSARLIYRDGGSTVIYGKPNIVYAEGRVVGGSTFMNGAMCWRTPEKILKQWQWERGLENFSVEQMQNYFERVEKIIQAKPMLAEAKNRDGELLKLGAERLGYRVRENLRSQDHCVGANQCLVGCPTGAKQTTANTYIPQFIHSGGDVYANCRVNRVVTHGTEVTGVEACVIHPDTQKKLCTLKVTSAIVVASCGAIQTPALLKRSGLGDAGGHLGKNLMVHPNAKVVAVFNEKVNAWKGVNQSHQITEFFDEGILMALNFIPPGIMSLALPVKIPNVLQVLKDEYHHMVAGAALIEDTSSGVVKTGPFQSVWPVYNLNAHDFKKTLRAVALLCEVFFSAGARKCYLPFHNLWKIESVDEIEKIYKMNLKVHDVELMTVHVMGTARMGVNPQQSVVNSHGEFHNMKGLFVADASVFPSSIGVNPQVTIMALATRTAEYIANHFQKYV